MKTDLYLYQTNYDFNITSSTLMSSFPVYLWHNLGKSGWLISTTPDYSFIIEWCVYIDAKFKTLKR